MNIVTGYRGEPHVTSQQDRDINTAIFGSESRIVKGIGSEMDATVVSATLVEVSDGTVVCQGCVAEIPRGTTESVTIENGSQGMLRTDLIVVRYSKNGGTGIEDMSLAVVKGTPVSFNPQTPVYTDGTIAEGDSLVDFPLYRVNINGISIDSIELIMNKVSVPNWINELVASDTALENKIGSVVMGTIATTITGAIKELVNKIGSITMGTTATTITGAIKEIKTALTTLQTHDSGQAITLVPASLGSISVQSSGGVEKIVSVASSIPSGYTLEDVIPAQTGSYAVYFYTCRKYSTSQVWVQLFRAANYYTSVTSVNPTVILVCKKNL